MIGWVESFIVLLPGNGWFVVLGIFNQTKKSCIIAFANENNLNFVSLIKNLGNWKTWDATIFFMDYKFPVNAKRLILLPWETAQKNNTDRLSMETQFEVHAQEGGTSPWQRLTHRYQYDVTAQINDVSTRRPFFLLVILKNVLVFLIFGRSYTLIEMAQPS